MNSSGPNNGSMTVLLYFFGPLKPNNQKMSLRKPKERKPWLPIRKKGETQNAGSRRSRRRRRWRFLHFPVASIRSSNRLIGEELSMSEEKREIIPPKYDIDAKWDECVDLTVRRFVYSSLAGAFGGLLLFRTRPPLSVFPFYFQNHR